MGWYALEEIEEALNETKELIWPPDFWTWTKLAVIVFFVGSGGFNIPGSMPTDIGSTNGDFSGGFDYDSTNVPQSMVQSSQDFDSMISSIGSSAAVSNVLVMAIAAVILPLILILMYLGSVFEFIFYRSLIDKNVNIRRNFRDNVWKGTRYFGFQLLYLMGIFGLVAALVGSFMASGALGVLVLLLFIPILIILAVFSGLTHDFVLLRMLEDDEKLVEAWKSFWPDLRSEWREAGVYIIVKFFIDLIVGIASMLALVIVTILLAIPAIILVILFGMLADILAVLIGVLFALLWLIVTFYVAVPFRTYIYYYVILVYHDLTS